MDEDGDYKRGAPSIRKEAEVALEECWKDMSQVLQYCLCILYVLGALFIDCPTKKGGHKASTYRQIELYPDPTRRSYCSGSICPTAYSRKDQLSI